MSRVQQMRGGRDNDPSFGTRMRGEGELAELLRRCFDIACKRLGLNARRDVGLDTLRFKQPRLDGQLTLF